VRIAGCSVYGASLLYNLAQLSRSRSSPRLRHVDRVGGTLRSHGSDPERTRADVHVPAVPCSLQ
jgi:hypothetical protein